MIVRALAVVNLIPPVIQFPLETVKVGDAATVVTAFVSLPGLVTLNVLVVSVSARFIEEVEEIPALAVRSLIVFASAVVVVDVVVVTAANVGELVVRSGFVLDISVVILVVPIWIVLLLELIVFDDNVSLVSLATNVLVPVGRVRVPAFDIVEITGAVSVLLVSVSVVFLPTRVSVASGSVSVRFVVAFVVIAVLVKSLPLGTIVIDRLTCGLLRIWHVESNVVPMIVPEVITGEVRVLLVSVSMDALVTIVSVTSGMVSVRLPMLVTLNVVMVSLAAFVRLNRKFAFVDVRLMLVLEDSSVLLVRVCTPSSVTYAAGDGISEVKAIVPVVDGSVRVAAPLTIDDILGDISVLFPMV